MTLSIEEFTLKQFACERLPPQRAHLAPLLEACVCTRAYCEERGGGGDYENLELLGDKILNAIFVQYVYDKYPFLMSMSTSPQIVTCLVVKFCSSLYLHSLCTAIELDKCVRTGTRERLSTRQINEDVLEAWCGVCKLIFGYERTEAHFCRLFDTHMRVSLDFDNIFNFKTLLNDVAHFLVWRRTNHHTNVVDSQINAEPEHEATLVYRNEREHAQTLIGVARAATQFEAEELAAQQVLYKMRATLGSSFVAAFKRISSVMRWQQMCDALDTSKYERPRSTHLLSMMRCQRSDDDDDKHHEQRSKKRARADDDEVSAAACSTATRKKHEQRKRE